MSLFDYLIGGCIDVVSFLDVISSSKKTVNVSTVLYFLCAVPVTTNTYSVKNGAPSPPICFHEELPFTAEISDVVISTEPTYNIWNFYSINEESMRTDQFLFYKRAGLYLVNKMQIHSQQSNHIYRRNKPQLREAKQKSFRMEATILLLICLGESWVWVWLETIEVLTVDMLLGISFIDCFIRKIFPIEHESSTVALILCGHSCNHVAWRAKYLKRITHFCAYVRHKHAYQH